MKTVIDEILSDEPKYRIKDGNGNVLYDNIVIEQITPATQEGTPLNKALFDSIHSHLLFNGRYVNLEGVNPSDYEMPDLSGASHDGYTMTWEYSNVDNLPATPYDLFGSSLSVYPKIKSNGYLNIEITLPTFVNIEKIVNEGSQAGLRVYGKLNAGDTYEQLSYSSSSGYFIFDSSKVYKYIKLEYYYQNFVDEFERTVKILGKSLSSATKIENIEYKIIGETLKTGQGLRVMTPSTYQIYDNIEYKISATDTQNINLPKTLEPSSFYELYYNGTDFLGIGG